MQRTQLQWLQLHPRPRFEMMVGTIIIGNKKLLCYIVKLKIIFLRKVKETCIERITFLLYLINLW